MDKVTVENLKKNKEPVLDGAGRAWIKRTRQRVSNEPLTDAAEKAWIK
jgi:hypothetical protein